MDSIIRSNADLLFRHKELIDSLTKEAASLRESEICLAKAFSEIPKELATTEVFELFMRDIHMAHKELNLRLQNLIQSQAGKEVANANNHVEELKSQLSTAQLHIATLENQLQQKKNNIDSLNNELSKIQKRLEDTLKDKSDVEKSFQQYQQLVQEKARHIKSEYLKKINNDNVWTIYGSTFEVMNQLIDWQVGDLENAKNALGDSSQKGLWHIRDKINEAIDTLWFNADVKEKLYQIRGELENFANSYPEGKNHIEQAQDKIVPLKARVDKENSSLSKLLSELNTICNEISEL